MKTAHAALAGAVTAGALGIASAPADAQQTFPARPIRFIVPYPPGGSTDPMARLAATKLTERFPHPVVVDNRPGGNTIIGTEAVAKATPDGYTILLASSALINTPSLIPKLPYDPVKDFTGVATIARSRFVLVVPVTSPANTLQELIALAKAKPGQLSYASSGIGANTHLSGALFTLLTGTKINHIPYKGSGTLQADLIAGRVDLSFQVPISVISHIRAGKQKALAVSGETRLPALPDVPTFIEGGLPNFIINGWFGIVAPTGSPKAAIERINKELAVILAMPDTQDYLVKQGSEAFISTPEQTTALIKSDIARNAKIIKDAGIKME
jgi:tripartite-type tricarboxylate transporter receptor subunit TctC